jgi:hypothetical protein
MTTVPTRVTVIPGRYHTTKRRTGQSFRSVHLRAFAVP